MSDLPQDEVSRHRDPWTRAIILVLGTLAILYTAWPVWRAGLTLEIDRNEPWNAYHADSVLAGKALYPDPNGFTVNNYPPLSFYLVAALSRATFDPLYVGRVLSFLAFLGTAAAIFAAIRQFGGSRLAGLAGTLWACATFARFYDEYVGMNDPSFVALALMTWGLIWLSHLNANKKAIEPAIVLMVIAGFFKHSLLAIPVTAILWVAHDDPRRGVRATIAGAVLCALGLMLCRLIYGEAFFPSLLMPREHSLWRAVAVLGRLQWIAPALIIVGIWAWIRRRDDAGRFTALFVTASFVSQFIERFGAGVGDNAHFELIVALGIGIGLAFNDISAFPTTRKLGIDWARFVLVLILVARLLISLRMSPYLMVASPEFRADLHERTKIAASEVARIAALPGPVVCSIDSVCRRAGKPFILDAFFVHQQIHTGRTSQDEVTRQITALGYRRENIDPRAALD